MSKCGCGHAFFTANDRKNRTLYTLLYAVKASVYKGLRGRGTFYGENEESVSCPDQDSGFFEAIVKKQSTQAVFVGHDHLNNMAVKYRGVDLVYSKSIDYYAYPGISDRMKQRGATLITSFSDGSYQIEQVDYLK